ncbi:MAG: hypothetical protein M3326_06575 [Actinomycetota bacterium]|nr:hypothetical protein [Actinomycetota bacterium]
MARVAVSLATALDTGTVTTGAKSLQGNGLRAESVIDGGIPRGVQGSVLTSGRDKSAVVIARPQPGDVKVRTGLSDLGVRAQRAHRASVTMSIADMASFLQDALGQKLVAYIAGVSDFKAVGRWAQGSRTPQPAATDRLRCAYQVFQLLQAHESPHTVRAWFVGLNPQLGDESPATAIRDGAFKDALVAARAFLTGG